MFFSVTDMVRGQVKNPYTTFWLMFFGLEGDCQTGTGHFIGFSGLDAIPSSSQRTSEVEGMQCNYNTTPRVFVTKILFLNVFECMRDSFPSRPLYLRGPCLAHLHRCRQKLHEAGMRAHTFMDSMKTGTTASCGKYSMTQ